MKIFFEHIFTKLRKECFLGGYQLIGIGTAIWSALSRKHQKAAQWTKMWSSSFADKEAFVLVKLDLGSPQTRARRHNWSI